MRTTTAQLYCCSVGVAEISFFTGQRGPRPRIPIILRLLGLLSL